MNNIRKIRKKHGMSQQGLSDILGISQQTISRIEKADMVNIPSGLLIKMAEIFHVSMEVLVGKRINASYENQEDEMWNIYRELDEVNKTTLLIMGRRLCETQQEAASEQQIGDKCDKNCNM